MNPGVSVVYDTRYAHFHQMAGQLCDSRTAMFCARCKIELGSFGRCHACAVCLTRSHS